MTATNNGPSNATGLVLTDTLPADISSNVTAMTSVPGVTATVAGGQVTASFGNVAVNDSVSLTITVVPTLASVTDSPLVDHRDRHQQRGQSEPEHGDELGARGARERPCDHDGGLGRIGRRRQ